MVKRHFLGILVVVILMTGASSAVFAQEPGAPGIGDSLYPEFGNSGYNALHYTLDLTVDPETQSLDGITTMRAMATQDLSSFNLDLIGFTVESVQVDGADAEFSREGQELTITPATPLASGAEFTSVVTYSGIPEQIYSLAIPMLTGWVIYDGGSYVLSEPDGAANFYPVNDHPVDKATYTISVTVPKPYEVAVNGDVIEFIDNGDTTTTIGEVQSPMASYLTTINIGDFDLVEEAGTNGVPIRNFYAVELGDEYRTAFARQDEMIGYFEELFGEYPFDAYGAVLINAELNAALETQTLSIFGIDRIRLDDIVRTEFTVAHELAHQWYGNSVSLSDWRDIWLNEGFATYAEALWGERQGGAEYLDELIRDVYRYAVEIDMPAPGYPTANRLFDDSANYRGALALHTLRLRISDDLFFMLLREWAARHRDSNVTTADFVALAAEISGQDLSDFFDTWIYQDALPPIPEMGLG